MQSSLSTSPLGTAPTWFQHGVCRAQHGYTRWHLQSRKRQKGAERTARAARGRAFQIQFRVKEESSNLQTLHPNAAAEPKAPQGWARTSKGGGAPRSNNMVPVEPYTAPPEPGRAARVSARTSEGGGAPGSAARPWKRSPVAETLYRRCV